MSDFKAVAGFGFMPDVIVVNPSVPVTNMSQLIALAKNSNPTLTYASAGLGISNHLSGELLAQEAHIQRTHIPYKGQSDARSDLLGGRVAMMPLTAALVIPHVKTGKLLALAVTSAKRASALPELPTVAKAAQLPNHEASAWFGLMAPAKTAPLMLQKRAADIEKVLAQPEVKAKFDMLGMELSPQAPAQFDTFIAKKQEKWSRVTKQAGIEPN